MSAEGDLASERDRIVSRIKQLREEVASSEGGKLQSELVAVARMYRLFDANERELQRHFGRYSDNLQALLELWDIDHPERFEAFLDETDRLLHNYLAAASSLADHTMRLWKKYPPQDESVRDDYEQRVAETFKDSALANFIQGLRNLTVHRKLPVIQGTMSFTGPASGATPALTAATVLNKEALLSWDGWKGKAKEYLAQAGDSIDIEQVVAEYTGAVHDFNEWFGKTWIEAHLSAFEAMHTLASEHDDLVRQVVGDDPFDDLRPS